MGRTPKRIVCQEPNRDVVKFCLVPVLITENAFRRRPDLIEFLSVTNSLHLHQRREFVSVVNHLELVRHRKCFFEDRFMSAWYAVQQRDRIQRFVATAPAVVAEYERLLQGVLSR